MSALPPVTAAPCSECPWRRNAVAGWLGPYDAEKWLNIAHADGPIACHKTIKHDGSWEGALQCAGVASFRANVCKSPRDPAVARGPRRADVFASNAEFKEHHEGAHD